MHDVEQIEGELFEGEFPGFDAREVEDVVQHPQEDLGALHGGLGHVGLVRRQGRVREQGEHAHSPR